MSIAHDYAEIRTQKLEGVMRDDNWEIVHHRGSSECTERLRIPGGFLYRTQIWSKADGTALALTFVPDPPLVRHPS